MEVHFKQETETKLNELAQRTRRGADELLEEAVEHLVAYNEWFERKVKDSQAAVARVAAGNVCQRCAKPHRLLKRGPPDPRPDRQAAPGRNAADSPGSARRSASLPSPSALGR